MRSRRAAGRHGSAIDRPCRALHGGRLHVAPSTFGLVFSIALVGMALGSFALGRLADRSGRKRVLIAATICFGVFTLATAFASNFGGLLAFRFLTGVGLGGAVPCFISLCSEYAPPRMRAPVVSLVWAGFPFGGVVGGLLASRLIPAFGWRSIFFAGGGPPLLIAFALMLVLSGSHDRRTPERMARAAQPVLEAVHASWWSARPFVRAGSRRRHDPALVEFLLHLHDPGHQFGMDSDAAAQRRDCRLNTLVWCWRLSISVRWSDRAQRGCCWRASEFSRFCRGPSPAARSPTLWPATARLRSWQS